MQSFNKSNIRKQIEDELTENILPFWMTVPVDRVNGGFYGAITNNAGGFGFYQSGARGRFLRLRFNSVPMDQPGRYFYLRDRENGDYWSAKLLDL